MALFATGFNAWNHGEEFEQAFCSFRAGNGSIVTVVNPDARSRDPDPDEPAEAPRCFLEKYACHQDWRRRTPLTKWPCESPVRDIAPYEAGFLVLHEDGSVMTVGDPRYPECLAREVTQES
ncbi:hypothetical protein UVI_02042040 [Ustilaginoidea virens]|uniref:Uncharacterized protein n=1 Tax=Ustilaginoidea virens TaxID=1159556 RepID=A0A1B5L6H8_USTVR|nr:hypothetical protein UVI_02042040 [Ustilaginoidea virens]